MQSHASRLLGLILFLALVLGGGTVIGIVTAPGPWYAALAKPSFNPPDWLFGPAWSVLYVMIAIAGWRLWNRARSSAAMKLWWLQLVVNFLWSPVFFAAHRIDLALVVVLLMLLSILAFIAAAWRTDRIASLLFLPYAAWVAFAALLNAALWRLN